MATWAQFAEIEPDLAEAGRQLFYQFGPGLGFLATIRSDGGPRLHPLCVIVGTGGLFVALVPSPKTRDLERDPRFALHAMPPEATDDEFAVTGRAVRVIDPARIAEVQGVYQNPIQAHDTVFELHLESALLARYKHRGDWPPTYTRWREAHGSDSPISESVASNT